MPPRSTGHKTNSFMRFKACADKLSLESMQSHNLQYAPARHVLHFFQFFKEHTSNTNSLSCHASSKTCRHRTMRCHRQVLLLVPFFSRAFWWSWSGSNRRPTACKAAALPAELQPPLLVVSRASQTNQKTLVGLVGFEPTTPALSRRCSNQLSYRPSLRGRTRRFLCLNNR